MSLSKVSAYFRHGIEFVERSVRVSVSRGVPLARRFDAWAQPRAKAAVQHVHRPQRTGSALDGNHACARYGGRDFQPGASSAEGDRPRRSLHEGGNNADSRGRAERRRVRQAASTALPCGGHSRGSLLVVRRGGPRRNNCGSPAKAEEACGGLARAEPEPRVRGSTVRATSRLRNRSSGRRRGRRAALGCHRPGNQSERHELW